MDRSDEVVVVDGWGPVAAELVAQLRRCARSVRAGAHAADAAELEVAGGGPPPRLVVLVSDRAVPEWCLAPSLAAPWHAHGVPVLPVATPGEGVVVGPLVVPGRTACLGCVAGGGRHPRDPHRGDPARPRRGGPRGGRRHRHRPVGARRRPLPRRCLDRDRAPRDERPAQGLGLPSRLWLRVGENGGMSEREQQIPGSSFARTARLMGLPLGHAGRAALGVGKRVGGRPAEAVAAELQARTAEQLFSVLGQLKGGAMKFGQALSVLEAAMPEEVLGPYRATLTRLQESGPPMGTDRVHAILAEELGPRWATTKLLELDDVPAAAASIGQVHRGVWRDGREVAVKIQYPGAGKALLSDLNQISRVARVAGSWVPGIDVKPIMDELRARMSEELDYALEARHQRHFARAFRDDDDVLVPDVLVDSPQVLVTEWVEGTPLARVIADGTQEQRDEAATLYLEFQLRSPTRARLLHADPHPGNFRITPDGRLGVLDFGAVNRLPDGMPPEMGAILTAALAGDGAELVSVLRRAGFIKRGIDIDPDGLVEYLQPLVEPILHEEFRPTREWLRGAAATLQDPRRPQFLVGLKLNLPPAYLLIHRVWLGGIGVLSQIGGTVPLREMVSRLPPRRRRVAAAPGPERALTLVTTRWGRACPRCCAGAGGCRRRTSTPRARSRCRGST